MLYERLLYNGIEKTAAEEGGNKANKIAKANVANILGRRHVVAALTDTIGYGHNGACKIALNNAYGEHEKRKMLEIGLPIFCQPCCANIEFFAERAGLI